MQLYLHRTRLDRGLGDELGGKVVIEVRGFHVYLAATEVVPTSVLPETSHQRQDAGQHELKRGIYTVLAARKGYRMLRVGPDTFNGTPAAFSQWELHDPLRLIKAESIGKE
jgi:hypothetical protein